MNGEEQILTERQVFAMRICITFFLMCVVLGGCKYFNDMCNLPADHFCEEFLEQAIEKHLDLERDSLDLTPESPER